MNQETYQDKPTLAKWNELVAAVGDAPKVVCGAYTGNGGSAQDTVVSQHFTLGFQPRAVLICTIRALNEQQATLLLLGYDYRSYYDDTVIGGAITADGFTVGTMPENTMSGWRSLPPELNRQDVVYGYVAIG